MSRQLYQMSYGPIGLRRLPHDASASSCFCARTPLVQTGWNTARDPPGFRRTWRNGVEPRGSTKLPFRVSPAGEQVSASPVYQRLPRSRFLSRFSASRLALVRREPWLPGPSGPSGPATESQPRGGVDHREPGRALDGGPLRSSRTRRAVHPRHIEVVREPQAGRLWAVISGLTTLGPDKRV